MPSIAISNHKSFPFFYCSFLFVGFRSRIYDVRLRLLRLRLLRQRLLHLRLLHLRLLRLNYCPLHHQLMMMINGYLQYVYQTGIIVMVIYGCHMVTILFRWIKIRYLIEKENNEMNTIRYTTKVQYLY